MNNLMRALILIVSCLLLTACITVNNDDNQSQTDNENQTPDEQTEKEPIADEPTENDADSDVEEEITTDNETSQETNEGEETNESEAAEDVENREIVAENKAFKVFEPTPNTEVKNQIVVRGLASVFEGTIQYAFEDGHFILDKGFTTASMGGPEWGEFEITINLANAPDGDYKIVLYEQSAKDGSNLHELIIPVHVSN